jgi:transposase
MPPKLSEDEVVALKILKGKGQSNCRIAETLGVTEGAVRYHLRRAGAADGRADKPRKAESVAIAIEHGIQTQQAQGPNRPEAHGLARPVNVRGLYEWLVAEHGYAGSYKSVLRFVRARYPRPKLRPYRRVETPAGAQAQVDWAERQVDVGDGPQKLYAFLLVLSHSRKVVVVWSLRQDQLAWHHCHNEALRRIGGVPAVLRIDNLKTGIAVGAGPWGEVNAAYRAYARSVGFHVDACLPHSPEHKGKVENQAGTALAALDLDRPFESLAALQADTDALLARRDRRRRSPATGLSVEQSWLAEQEKLQPLPLLPQVFDVAVTRKVHGDCMVNFEDHSYSVPFVHCGRQVEVRGASHTVQVLDEGRVVAEHPRGTPERVVIDPAHYEGPGDERVAPPTPLGRLGRRLQEIVSLPVEQRPLDLYAALAEVCR